MCLMGLSVSSTGIYSHKSLTLSQEKVPSSSEAHPPPAPESGYVHPHPRKWLCSPPAPESGYVHPPPPKVAMFTTALSALGSFSMVASVRNKQNKCSTPVSRGSCDIGEQSVGFSQVESSVLSVASTLFIQLCHF